MERCRNKFVAGLVVAIITLTSLLNICSSVTTAKASSSVLSLAGAKVDHLSWSLHNNYLGIKNQGQWEAYIKEIREIIYSSSESKLQEAIEYLEFLDKAEALVKGLSRINQVEKSIQTNYLGIKNARQWNYYIILAEYDLLNIDMKEFSKEYNELVGRMEKCQRTIEGIETKFEVEYSSALKVYFTAEASRKVEDARKAYSVAKELGTCEESDYLENECRMLLVRLGDLKISSDEVALQDAYSKLDTYLQETGMSISGSAIESIKKQTEKIIGSNIYVEVTVEFINPRNGEETYQVILSKGNEKMHPIVIVFSKN